MADEREQFGVEAVLDLDQWSSNVAQVLRDAGRIERTLGALTRDLNDLNRQMGSLQGDINVRVTANMGDLDTAQDIIADIDDEAVRVRVQGVFDDLEAAQRIISDIDAAAPTVTISASDSDLLAADRLVDDIDAAAPNVTINADDSELDGVRDQLEDLRSLAVLDIVINVAGPAIGLGKEVLESSVGRLLEMDTALQGIEGRTGRMIPQARELIVDLYTNAWGESRQAIADVITEASNLNIEMDDLEEAVRNTFFITDLSPDSDPREILRTMDSLIKNNLVPDFDTAADLLATGFQIGADRGQDLLDTFNEYGTTFKELGISGPGALALINSGLESGIDNSDRVADAIREIGIRLTEIGDDENMQAAVDSLERLSGVDISSQIDAFHAGELSGDEFFEGFFNALETAAASDPVEADRVATALVGTIAEDFGLESVSQLSTAWDETMGTLEGRAEEASNTINDTLSTKLTEVQRTLEQVVVDFLESEQVNLDERLDTFKAQLGTFIDEIQAGTGIGDALAIAFDAPQLRGVFERLASGLGNFQIVLLQVIEGLARIANNPQLAEQAGAEVARLGAQQLVVDLQLQDEGAGVESAIRTAIQRGVDPAILGQSVNDAFNQALTEGDFTAARTIIEGVGDVLGVPFQEELSRAFELAVGGAQFDFEQALAGRDFGLAASLAAELESVIGGGEFFQRAFESAFEGGDLASALDIAEAANDPALISQVENAATTVRQLFDEALAEGQADQALALATSLGDEELIARAQAMKDEVTAATGEMATGIEEDAARIHTVTVGSSITTDLEAIKVAAETHLPPMNVIFQTVAGEAELMGGRVGEAFVRIEAESARLSQASQYVDALASSMREGLGNALPVLDEVIKKLKQIASAGTNARNVVNSVGSAGGGGGGDDETPSFQHGGVAGPGVFSAAPGEELLFSDERIAVLNAETSRSLFAALETLGGLGLGGGDVSNTRNVTVNQTIYTNSRAESENVGFRTAQQVRGF